MNLNEWREKRRPQEAILPSGLHVQLKPVSLQSFLVSGTIPLPLLKQVTKEYGNGAGQVEIDPSDAVEKFAEFTPMLDAVTRAAIVGVLIGDDEWATPEEAQFDPVSELDVLDKGQIVGWALRGVGALEGFREKRDANEAPAQRGNDLPPAPEPHRRYQQ